MPVPPRVLFAVLAFAALVVLSLGGGALAASEPASAPVSAAAADTLRPGDRGPAVKKLQRRLGIRADGHYGRATERAVRRFQRRRGLTPDGIAGPATLRALGIRPAGSSSGSGGTAAGGGTGAESGSSGSGSSVRLPAVLRRIAQCESGGNPRAVSPDGRYRGKFQFSMDTWRALGGRGDPAKATEAEQDRRALALYRREGTSPWPNCA